MQQEKKAHSRLSYENIKMTHTVSIQARFGDYDTFGHVNNNTYMSYLDLGKSEFFIFAMGRQITPAELSAAIVNINVDFLFPAVMGEPLEVQSAVTHLGDRSFTLYQRVTNSKTGQVKVQATSILAGFDIKTQSGAELRPELRQKLQNILVK